MSTDVLRDELHLPTPGDIDRFNQFIEAKKPSRLGKLVTEITVVASVVAGLSAAGSAEASAAVAQHTKPYAVAKRPQSTTTIPEVRQSGPDESIQRELFQDNEDLGAMIIERTQPEEAGQPDDIVVHNLDDAQWDSSDNGVNSATELDNGPVYNQNSAWFGTLGKTTIVAAHNVTPIHSPLIYNGTYWDQTEMMASSSVKPDPNDPYGGQGDLLPGDLIKIIVNNPGETNGVQTEAVFTYKVIKRSVISASNNTAVQALQNPPESQNVSLMRLYNCWEPHSEDYREVDDAELISEEEDVGHVTATALLPPAEGNTDIQ